MRYNISLDLPRGLTFEQAKNISDSVVKFIASGDWADGGWVIPDATLQEVYTEEDYIELQRRINNANEAS